MEMQVSKVMVSIALLCMLLLSGCQNLGSAGRNADDVVKKAPEIARGLDDAARAADDAGQAADDAGQAADDAAGAADDAGQAADELVVPPAISAEVDAVAASQARYVEDWATYATQNAVDPSDAEPSFMDEFANITQDAILGIQCGQVLDAVAPENQPVQAGEESEWIDPVAEAIDRLSARGYGATYARLVDWYFYAQSVQDGAARLSNALLQPANYQRLATSPTEQIALVVYVRMCYSPPK